MDEKPLSTTMNPAPFPFFDLPAIVQWKTLRQYLGFSGKVTMLANIPEFAACLVDPETPCWLPPIHSLSPGFYVRVDDPLPHILYHVTMERENRFSILCCSVFFPLSANNAHSQSGMVNFVESEAVVNHFTRFFLNGHVLQEHQPIKSYTDIRYNFLINLSRKIVLWEDLTIHEINEKGKCDIQINCDKRVRISLDPRDAVSFFDEKGEKEMIRGRSLASLISTEMFPLAPEFLGDSMIAMCCFHLAGDCSSVSVKIYNPSAYRFCKETGSCAFAWFDSRISSVCPQLEKSQV